MKQQNSLNKHKKSLLESAFLCLVYCCLIAWTPFMPLPESSAQFGFFGGGNGPFSAGGNNTVVETPQAGGKSDVRDLAPAPLPGSVFTAETIRQRQTLPAEEDSETSKTNTEKSDNNTSGKPTPADRKPKQGNATDSGLETPVSATEPDTVVAGTDDQDVKTSDSAMIAPDPQTVQNQIKQEALDELKSKIPPQHEYRLGFPQSDKILEMLESEMRLSLKSRAGVDERFNVWTDYLKSRLNATKNSNGIGGYNGLARLNWMTELLTDPLHSVVETDTFSRNVHGGILYGKTKGYNFMLRHVRAKMDVPLGPPALDIPVANTEEAYKVLAQRLGEVKGLHAKMIARLKPEELRSMNANLYNVMTVQATVGHTVNDRTTARNYIMYLRKLNYSAMYDAAGILFSFTEPNFLDKLAALNEETAKKLDPVAADSSTTVVKGVTGEVIMMLDSPAGKIVVGGKGMNTYKIEEMGKVACIVDLGGADTYYEGMVSMNRPLLVIMDLGGDDIYTGRLPGIQGSAILGFSMLLDRSGNDTYKALHMAQGSCLGGVGILLDMAGNDKYNGTRRVQGTALAGLGLAIDLGGDDSYHAAMWSQGLGHPLGFGLLENATGDDTYYTGGIYPDSYDDTPGYEGWGQGLGSGLRDIANGGIGMLLEGAGDDRYEYDYIAHGGGYWMGIGILRDFNGNDNHAGATQREFNGGQRRERRFQRLGNGFGCHYAIGYLFDDFGDDTYASTIMNTGFGWDASSGFLCDFAGDDKYTAVGGGSGGNGAQASLGVLFDYDGSDTYSGRGQGYASPSINPEYHQLPGCGGNFAFVVDYGGKDVYGSKVPNNGAYRRGSSGGFIIDRPENQEKLVPPVK